MKFIGLSGGIGAGKSTVGRYLAARGAVVMDVDDISKELQQPGRPFYEAIVARWGPTIVAPDGQLDRRELSRIVFGDEEQLKELTAMAAPVTEVEIVRQASEHVGTDRVVVVQAAMYSAPMYGMTGLAVVDAPVEVAVGRLVALRGMSEEDARARIASQITRQERLEKANFIVDNSGDTTALDQQADSLLVWAKAEPDATPTLRRY